MSKAKRLTDRQIAEQLEEIRLEKRWSFRELGEEIGKVLQSPAMPEPTVRKFIQEAGSRSFHDTTVYPFRKYIENLPDDHRVSA